MAGILEPYTITTLPRISLLDSSKSCIISEITDKESNYIDLGVSGSIIGTYILRPTPKLVWSYAISPSTIVTALASFGNIDGDKRFIVGLNERKKNKLALIEKSETGVTNEEEASVVKSRSLELKSEVRGVKFSQNGKLVYVLLANGEVQLFNFNVEAGEEIEPISKIEGNKRSKVVFNQFISEISGSEIVNVEGYLLSVESTSTKFLTVKIFALLKNNQIIEINQLTIDCKLKEYEIQYDSNGHLIIYDIDTQTISIYALPKGNLVKSISVSNRVKDLFQDKVANIVSITVPAPNRIFLGINDSALLIDTKFEAVLDAFNTSKRSNLRILTSPNVKGNSLKTRETFALILSTDLKESLTTVQNFAIDVGLGTLNDCLGKGINRIQKKTLKDEEFFANEITGLSSLINEKNLNSDEEFFIGNSISSKHELFEVYKHLKKAKESNNITKWEGIFLPYVKGTPWKDILNENSQELDDGKQDFQVFELEKDRIIDSRFFYKIASLIFTKNEEKQITLLSKDFVPEKTLTYLLTHPLFPMEFSNGLLQSLHKFPRLVRQAIVTCPNLSCFELIQQLNVIENEEIFKDLIIRLSEEYSSEKITLETTKIISTNNKKRRKSLQATFDLDKIISKIINLNFGFEILNSFIDSNGLILSLHYSKNENNLDKLINKIDNKTNSLLINSQLLTLVDQSLINSNELNNEGKKSNKKKKSKSKQQQQQVQKKLKPLTISEDVDDTRVKLDSMLSIDKNNNLNDVLLNNKNNNVVDQLNKKVPSYSIDKLIL